MTAAWIPFELSSPDVCLCDLCREPGQGYVYFIEGQGLTKIGFTNDIDARLRQLDAMSPVPLTLVDAAVGTIELETDLHRELAEYRRHGEWFALPDRGVKARIARTVRAYREAA